MEKKKIKDFFKKFWYIVWKDESLKGWIISLIFIFIIIKFVFFPLLSLATGTGVPIAIVESCSMHHKGNIFSDFDRWWEDHKTNYREFDIDKQRFKDFDFKNGFTKGDVLFIVGNNRAEIEKGDVILFQGPDPTPVIHRVVDIRNESGERVYTTMGDNVRSEGPHSFEERILKERVIGKAVANIVPRAGWIKLIWFEPFREKGQKGTCDEF